MSDEFSWSQDAEHLVFPSIRGVSAYWNPDGDVVIRQEAGWFDQEDSVIFIPVSLLPALIERLRVMEQNP